MGKEEKNKFSAEPIKFNVPQFELKTNINNFNHIQNVNIINNDRSNVSHQSNIKKKKKSKKRKKRKRHRDHGKATQELANHIQNVNPSTLSKEGQIFHNSNNVNPKIKFEAIIHSLMKFE